mmetsp:Transcript_81940/g.196462  ORF Transcript_81940/g.196462 Transcript_81940/m.196462 type:complete len:218 (+) Transcript_81940:816-1469(+)
MSWFIWSLSILTLSTSRSMSKHFVSISLSFWTNSVSIMALELEISSDRASCFTTAPFMRSMSKRRCFMLFSSSRISFSWPVSWPSIRSFFCSKTIFLFLFSLSIPFSLSVSLDTDKSCVCFWIQSFCMSEHSFVSSAMAFRMCFSLASCGPATSSSLPISASSFVLFSSYSLFRRSTKSCFFSIWWCLFRISCSYCSMSFSRSASSSLSCLWRSLSI